jgi:hypothetical protein
MAEGGEESIPRKRGERVVASWRTRSGTTAATPRAVARDAAADGDIRAEKPWSAAE